MLIANYHTHTPRCFHAVGSDEEYVQAAMDIGLRVLGFSDHSPQWFPGDYYSGMRMYPNQLSEYSESILGLQKKYAGQLEVHLGVEAEYYPQIFGTLVQQLRDHGVEYLIMGQHWAGCEQNEPYSGRPFEDDAYLRRYYHQVMDGLNTGLYTYLAHPDMANFVGDDHIYEQYIRALCREANSCGIPLEFNLLGLGDGRHYPRLRFWQIAAEENCRCIIGFDAHSPQALKNMDVYHRATEILSPLGIEILDTVPLRPLK